MIRHAKGIEVSDFKVIAQAPDARPCFTVEDAAQVDFFRIKAEHHPNTPVFVLDNVKDFSAAKCDSIPDTQIGESKHKELRQP